VPDSGVWQQDPPRPYLAGGARPLGSFKQQGGVRWCVSWRARLRTVALTALVRQATPTVSPLPPRTRPVSRWALSVGGGRCADEAQGSKQRGAEGRERESLVHARRRRGGSGPAAVRKRSVQQQQTSVESRSERDQRCLVRQVGSLCSPFPSANSATGWPPNGRKCKTRVITVYVDTHTKVDRVQSLLSKRAKTVVCRFKTAGNSAGVCFRLSAALTAEAPWVSDATELAAANDVSLVSLRSRRGVSRAEQRNDACATLARVRARDSSFASTTSSA